MQSLQHVRSKSLSKWSVCNIRICGGTHQEVIQLGVEKFWRHMLSTGSNDNWVRMLDETKHGREKPPVFSKSKSTISPKHSDLSTGRRVSNNKSSQLLTSTPHNRRNNWECFCAFFFLCVCHLASFKVEIQFFCCSLTILSGLFL